MLEYLECWKDQLKVSEAQLWLRLDGMSSILHKGESNQHWFSWRPAVTLFQNPLLGLTSVNEILTLHLNQSMLFTMKQWVQVQPGRLSLALVYLYSYLTVILLFFPLMLKHWAEGVDRVLIIQLEKVRQMQWSPVTHYNHLGEEKNC